MFILLEEAGLKPNRGSYFAALECMGRNPNCSPKVVSRYVAKIHTHRDHKEVCLYQRVSHRITCISAHVTFQKRADTV